jgi:G3E family GTPase
MPKVPCDVVTGFLGSGKTTLLKYVLAHGLDQRRVAIVMNDLGDLGVEGKVIKDLGAVEKLVELDNGCICCSIGFQFALAIQDILETARPELVVIETTGVADPRPLVGELSGAGLSLDAVITVVDAEQVLNRHAESVVTDRQIEAADFIVLNKLDLVDDRQRRRVEKHLRRLNDRALVLPTTWSEVQTDILFGTGVRRYRERLRTPGPEGPGHLADDAFSAFLYRGEHLLSRPRFEGVLRDLPPSIFRAKGSVSFAGESMPSLFNYTCGRFDFQWYSAGPEPVRPQAVFVGKNVDEVRDKILARLALCELPSPRDETPE